MRRLIPIPSPFDIAHSLPVEHPAWVPADWQLDGEQEEEKALDREIARFDAETRGWSKKGRRATIIRMVREYGIKPGTTEAAEVLHALGEKPDSKKIHVRLIVREDAKRFQSLASALTDAGLVPPDEWDRPDESACLEAIIEAVRGRG